VYLRCWQFEVNREEIHNVPYDKCTRTAVRVICVSDFLTVRGATAILACVAQAVTIWIEKSTPFLLLLLLIFIYKHGVGELMCSMSRVLVDSLKGHSGVSSNSGHTEEHA
jgi:hypothetical protein